MSLEKTLMFIKKLLPESLFVFFQPFYHYFITLFFAIKNFFPSRKIKIIALTGTKGKTSTTEILNVIFKEAGFKTALANGLRFEINEESELNKYKMTMPGRGFLQNFLANAVKKDSDVAILETTSEGALQFRNRFIDFDAFLFLNISPEHIDRHKGFENYKKAKLSIIKNGLEKSKKKNKILIVNKDSNYSNEFFDFDIETKEYFSLSEIQKVEKDDLGLEFYYDDVLFKTDLIGEFNISNILGCIKIARSFGISYESIQKALKKIKKIPGRAEKVLNDKGVDVFVDYAHTPDSLEAIYKAFSGKNKICVLGACGGGRDKWKRKDMAEISEKYCQKIILTNEDPYDEDPNEILNDMEIHLKENKHLRILDRKLAIKKSLEESMDIENSVVLITGKGTDPYIMGPNGTKTKWLDSKIVQHLLEEM